MTDEMTLSVEVANLVLTVTGPAAEPDALAARLADALAVLAEAPEAVALVDARQAARMALDPEIRLRREMVAAAPRQSTQVAVIPPTIRHDPEETSAASTWRPPRCDHDPTVAQRLRRNPITGFPEPV